MLRLLTILVVVAAPVPALAQVVSERPDKVGIVVYPPLYGVGLVMVTERRTVDVPAGPAKIVFRGVADGIVPQTVAVQGLTQGVNEQNFDYQLLSPGSLIRQSEGRMISLVRTNPATGQVTEERARVVSGGQGAILDIDGRLEALKCSALPERIVLSDLPPGFSDKPTLSVETISPVAGRRVLTLSYLAIGVSWKADYVARVAADGRSLSLSSWITLTNASDTSFAEAPVQVIAGRLQRRPEETRPVTTSRAPFQPNCWEINSGRAGIQQIIATGQMLRVFAEEAMQVDEIMVTAARASPPPPPPAPAVLEDLGDYKLYTLPEPTAVAARQTKQVTLFNSRQAPFDLRYRAGLSSIYQAGGRRPAAGPQPMNIVLELENRKDRGLGLPLPEGNVAVFEPREGGRTHFLGQSRIKDTPEGLPVEFITGASPQVQYDAVVTDNRRAGQLGRVTVKVTLTNARDTAVETEVREAVVQNFKVVSESHAHQMKYGAPQWLVTVPANGSVEVTYTLEGRV